MSETTAPPKKRKRFPAFESRLGAIGFSSLIGPPIAMIAVYVLSILYSLATTGHAAFDDGIILAVLFSPVAWFIPFAIGIIGLAFTAHKPHISLKSVLITTTLCLLPFYLHAPIMILGALISATLCWRITKYEHSPETTP